MIIKRILIFIMMLFSVIPVINGEEKINVGAKCAILMEQTTNRIIYHKNANEIHLTASICKILTAITAIENGDLDKYCKVDQKTVSQIGSSIYLEVGDEIKLIDLLYGLLLRSGNDAAYLIANNVGKSYQDFIYLMNETAKKIKMTSSTFTNPSGLDEETQNYSTAFDMALLMSYAMNNETYMKINGTKNHSVTTKNGNNLFFTNKHRLIQSYDEVIGGKTGYTQQARRTLVSCAEKNNLKLIVVTFDCGNDFNEHMALFNYGFSNYANEIILNKQILKVDNQFYRYTPYIVDNISYPVTSEEKKHLFCIIKLYKQPISLTTLGYAQIYLKGQLVKEVKVYRYY